MNDFNFDDLFNTVKYAELYKVHPHLDKYPDYLRNALINSETIRLNQNKSA
jgi:hypothetical protein